MDVACATSRLAFAGETLPFFTELSTGKSTTCNFSLPCQSLPWRQALPLRFTKSPRLMAAASTSSTTDTTSNSSEDCNNMPSGEDANLMTFNRRQAMAAAGSALSTLSLTFGGLSPPPSAFAEEEEEGNVARDDITSPAVTDSELPQERLSGADPPLQVETEEVAPPVPAEEPVVPKPEVKPETKPEKADKVDTTITDRVYFDISVCPTSVRLDRTLGDSSLICSDGEPLGRIVIGLYGKQVPQTVGNFVAMCTGKAGSRYEGTIFHKTIPGQFIMAGRQGSRERGEVSAPSALETNVETVSPAAYRLSHLRPGTVSLALSVNDDDEDRKLSGNYRNVEFLITTGPGPATQLDNGNIVIGSVLEGMDVVTAIANIPTYRPSEKIQQFNEFAQFLGDERASAARAFWDKPLKSVVISHCGTIEPPKSPLPPILP